eukprot:1960972-Heterocapsa_arctica.AAC.1
MLAADLEGRLRVVLVHALDVRLINLARAGRNFSTEIIVLMFSGLQGYRGELSLSPSDAQ